MNMSASGLMAMGWALVYLLFQMVVVGGFFCLFLKEASEMQI